MKKRILFVDDEEFALRGLRRLLYSMHDEWEMEFFDSGAKALERMEAAPFDVVVSDMRMPGINGAELLNEVMKQHPKAVRLILSGYADRDLILKCVGSTHQYLAKPCDAHALKMTIRRAANLETSMKNEGLRQLVNRCTVLPSVPAIYSEIVEALQTTETDIQTIGDIIARDTAMTAKILKLVNSAFFGLGHEISNLSEAVAYLGTDTIKSLVLFSNIFSQYEQLHIEGFSVEKLWRHSLKTAEAARWVAALNAADKKLGDEAYVSGLLHDAGKLILAFNLTTLYDRAVQIARSEKIPVAAAERVIFEADHAVAGGYLLGLWGLPVPIVEAITFHHKPSAGIDQKFSPLTALHIGNVLASSEESAIADVPACNLDVDYLQTLGLWTKEDDWRKMWRKLGPAQAENVVMEKGGL